MKKSLEKSVEFLTLAILYLIKGIILLGRALYKGMFLLGKILIKRAIALFQKLKKVNYQALLLSIIAFWLFGYALSTIITEIVSNIQIENIDRNSGWGVFNLVLVALSTLIARKVYKWLDDEK